jgi:hypothetical protein
MEVLDRLFSPYCSYKIKKATITILIVNQSSYKVRRIKGHSSHNRKENVGVLMRM